MKYHVRIQTEHVRVDETVEGNTEAEVWQQAREEALRRAPFLARTAIRMMSDEAIWSRITRHINETHQLQEKNPTSAREFIEMGIRTGYITRLD